MAARILRAEQHLCSCFLPPMSTGAMELNPSPPSLIQRLRLLSPSPIHGATLSSSFFPLALAPCRRAARPLPPCAAALPTPPWSAQGPSDPSSSSELTVAHGAPTPCYTFSRPPLPSAPFSLLAVDVGALSKTASFQRPLHLLWKTASPHGVLVFSLLSLASRARCRDTLAAAPPRVLPARRYAQPAACGHAGVLRSACATPPIYAAPTSHRRNPR